VTLAVGTETITEILCNFASTQVTQMRFVKSVLIYILVREEG
jgi:hypothetical protein